MIDCFFEAINLIFNFYNVLMNKFCFSILLLLSINQMFAQNVNFIDYKKDCDLAYRLALDSNNYSKSIVLLENVKKKYNFLCTEEYVLKAFCYKMNGEITKSAKSLKDAWSNYAYDLNCLMQIDQLQPPIIMDGYTKRQNKIVEQGYKNSKKLKSEITDSLFLVFDRIDSLDQVPRLKELIDTSANGKKLYFNEIKRVDSLNLVEFKNIIYKYGYPGERLLPLNSARAFLLLTHSSYNQDFYNEMKSVFLNEVKCGRMPPSHYVFWIDRHNYAFKLPLEYGVLDLPSENKFNDSQKVDIYKKRLELGLIKHFPLPSKQLLFL